MVIEADSKLTLSSIVEPARMQRSPAYDGFASLNNNSLQAVNANVNNIALEEINEGIAGFTDREEEYPFDLEIGGDSSEVMAPVTQISNIPIQYITGDQGGVLNSVKLTSCVASSNSQTLINSVPNFTFTTPTQSAMYSPPLMSSNHGYKFQRATPQTFSPTGCTPWQHSVPNRIPWMGQTIGMTVSSHGVSIFTAPLGSRPHMSWANTSPHATITQDPSPSCSQIPRRPKRASTENLEYLSPTNKIHLTEKMIADHMKELTLNNIAIPGAAGGIQPLPTDFMSAQRSSGPVDSVSSQIASQQSLPDIASRDVSINTQWQEFRDLEERLEVSDDESLDQSEAKDKSAAKVVFLEDIPKNPTDEIIPQKILDALQKPSPTYELVLWQPPEAVVKKTFDKATEKKKEKESLEPDSRLSEGKEEEATMDLDLCEGDDMML